MTDNFVINEVNGKWIIGTNKSIQRNGVYNWELAGPVLTIPSVINGHQIEEIGQWAFFGCYYIEEVFISNSIKSINNRSFSDCFNLRSIVIPPSVEFIGYCGIHTYNASLASINLSLPNSSEDSSNGTLTVVFQPNSQIKYIDQHGISRKKNIIIYYNDKSYFPCHKDPFFKSVLYSIKIYSPYTNSFCNYPTIHAFTCKQNLWHQKSLFFFIFLFR